jgi:hypothetical protein
LELEETQGELTKNRAKIDVLKAFFVNIKKRWKQGNGTASLAPSFGHLQPVSVSLLTASRRTYES